MSSAGVPPVSGQIESPNPIELFWEKNKRLVTFGAAAVALAIGASYGVSYMKKRGVDRTWSAFSQSANLDAGYSQDGTYVSFLNDQNMQQQFGGQFNMTGIYLGQTRSELVSQLRSDLLEAGVATLAQERTRVAGTELEPLLLWLMAIRNVEAENWDDALAQLQELQTRFPDCFVCAVSDYPPQFRPTVEEEDEETGDEEKAGQKKEKPELEPPVRGSLASLLADQVRREQTFRREAAKLYEPDAIPTDAPTVVVHFSNDESIRIRLLPDAAKVHVENFLTKVRSGFYDGQYIDQVERKPQGNEMAPNRPIQMHFGLAATKNQADRTVWQTARNQDGETLEFESNDLSHFPGSLAAAPAKDGKSSAERVWITANDAPTLDGERVIFGRVVKEDLDVVESICTRSLADTEMDQAGRGQLAENVQITSIQVEGEAHREPGTSSLPQANEGGEGNGEKPEDEKGK